MDRLQLIARIAPLALILFLTTVSVVFAEDGGGILANINEGIKMMLWNIVVSVFGFFAAVGGNVFDYALNTFVLGFGDSFRLGGFGQAVDTLWIYIRDFFNLLFIFGLVWLGLKMILNSAGADTKRWLGTLILAALLVNFSLYITKAIVDFSNIIAITILNASNIVPASPPPGGIQFSDRLMDIVGLTTIFALNGVTADEARAAVLLGEGGYAYIFGTAIFLIIAAFVFAAGGLLLIIRFVVLSIYMVFSPFMFIGWVLPQFASVQRQYWSGFLSRAFYAPLYVFLIWFSFFVLERYFNASVLQQNQNFAGMLTGGGDRFELNFASTFIPFVLACILLIASIIVAQKLSIDGGNQAVKMWGRYRRQIPRMAYYGGTLGIGYLANQKARQASYAAGQGINRGVSRLQARAQSIDPEKYNSRFGKRTARMARAAGTSTAFDRTARGAAKKLEEQKFDLANTEAEDRRQQGVITARAERENVEMRGVVARDELRDIESGSAVSKTGRIYNPDTQKMEDRSSKSDDDIIKLLEKNRAKLQTTVAAYTDKEVEAMAQQQPERLKAIVGELKPSRFEKGVIESELVDVETKNDLRNARQTAIQDSLKVNGEVMTDRLQSLNKQQMTELSDQFFEENAADFKQSQVDDYLKSDDVTQGQKNNLLGARSIQQRTRGGTAAGADKLFNDRKYDSQTNTVGSKRKKPEEVAKLPFATYQYKDASGTKITNTEAVSRLSTNDVEQIYNKKDMSLEDRNQLRDLIASNGSTEVRNYLKSPQGRRLTNNQLSNKAQATEQRAWEGELLKSNNDPTAAASRLTFGDPSEEERFFEYFNKNKANIDRKLAERKSASSGAAGAGAKVNPHNQFGSPAEAQRWAKWEKNNRL